MKSEGRAVIRARSRERFTTGVSRKTIHHNEKYSQENNEVDQAGHSGVEFLRELTAG